METLNQYRAFIQKVLLDFAQHHQPNSKEAELELQPIFDVQRDRYQLLYIGWHNKKRIYTPILHFDIKDHKIWLQLNTTEEDPTAELIKLGVPKEDIVLGFQSPFMRQFTEFAVS